MGSFIWQIKISGILFLLFLVKSWLFSEETSGKLKEKWSSWSLNITKHLENHRILRPASQTYNVLSISAPEPPNFVFPPQARAAAPWPVGICGSSSPSQTTPILPGHESDACWCIRSTNHLSSLVRGRRMKLLSVCECNMLNVKQLRLSDLQHSEHVEKDSFNLTERFDVQLMMRSEEDHLCLIVQVWK